MTALSPTALALISIAVGAVTFALKLTAWALTGSVALFSDAAESVVNIAAAVATLIAVRYSRRPADDNHPYGHSKAEYLSAVLEGVLIIIAAVVILREAWFGFVDPGPLEVAPAGLAVTIVAAILNGVWATVLLRAGRKLSSPAIAADGRHLMTDVVTSVGVIVGIGLVAVTGWRILDPVLAVIVALNILWSGGGLIRESVGGLMDEAPPEAERARIHAVIAANCHGAIEAHDVRTRHVGPRTFIEFHLVVDGAMSVKAAHDICDRLEAALRAEVDLATITIHIEPDGKAEASGLVPD